MDMKVTKVKVPAPSLSEYSNKSCTSKSTVQKVGSYKKSSTYAI